jgi:hypothetical protein
MEITRIKNDVNGNPRKVVHFLEFITFEDHQTAEGRRRSVSNLYELALQKARRVGGKKFHNKQFGGGIVFQSYCDNELRSLVAKAREFSI